MKKKRLVFIVTYKSSKKIKDIFDKISKIKSFKLYDIYISDDNSPDDTGYHLRKIKKKNVKISFNKKNLGYGGNIKKCLLYAIRNNYKEAVMIHGDDQYHVKYVPKLLDSLNDRRFSAATGSRLKIKLNALKGKMPIYKFIGNIFLTFLFNLVFKTDFTDCHTGLWAYKISELKKINFDKLDDGYNFDSQMRITLTNKNLKIKEIPIQTFYRDEHSSYHIKYSSNFIKELFVYR
tara:strand:- start:2027 stop:2728 length:702 start_codon:yes stop_codon:yes gene_type:complete